VSDTTPRPLAIEIANQFADVAPVDLEAMANAMSIRVNMNANLPANISGKITCRDSGRDSGRDAGGGKSYFIDVNASHSENRKRFTLAHEIAHFMLHRHLMQGGITDNEMYRSGLSDQVEMEANRLAAELLMPARLVREYWRNGHRSYAQLADIFGASPEATRIRLNQLGYGA
jgi:Zn-dependent peptidase ImmA (M78 family)